MLTPKRLSLPTLTGDWSKDGPKLYQALSTYFLALEGKNALTIDAATGIDNTPIGASGTNTGQFSQVAIGGAALTDPLNVSLASGNAARFTHSTTNAATGGLVGWYEGTTLYGFINQRGSTHAEAGQWNIGNNNANAGIGFYAGATQKLVLTSDGRLYGAALHNSSGAVTGTTNQYIASGTYTPTVSTTTNVSASTARECKWIRVGNVVTVWGYIDVTPTSASALTQFELSLPIASNLATVGDLSGNGSCYNGGTAQNASVKIEADAGTDAALFTYFSPSNLSRDIHFSFGYEVK